MTYENERVAKEAEDTKKVLIIFSAIAVVLVSLIGTIFVYNLYELVSKCQ